LGAPSPVAWNSDLVAEPPPQNEPEMAGNRVGALAGSLLVHAVARTKFLPRRREFCLAEVARLEQIKMYLLISFEAESASSSQGLCQRDLYPLMMKCRFGRREPGQLHEVPPSCARLIGMRYKLCFCAVLAVVIRHQVP